MGETFESRGLKSSNKTQSFNVQSKTENVTIQKAVKTLKHL